MRILPARAGALVLFSPALAVADQADIKVHMIFAEEGLIELMAVEGRDPERVRDA
jgi:hypothetical protein